MLELVRGILSELQLDAVLERALEAAREVSGATYAALGVLNESRSELERFIAIGVDEETWRRIGEPPTGRGVLGELIDHPVPLRLADLGAHPHSYGFPPEHPAMKTFLGVPVLVAGRPFGNIYLTEKAGGEQFSETDEEAVVGENATSPAPRSVPRTEERAAGAGARRAEGHVRNCSRPRRVSIARTVPMSSRSAGVAQSGGPRGSWLFGGRCQLLGQHAR